MINNIVKRTILILPLILLTSCGPTKCPFADSPNSTEPTLQSAEDAMRKEFNEDNFK